MLMVTGTVSLRVPFNANTVTEPSLTYNQKEKAK